MHLQDADASDPVGAVLGEVDLVLSDYLMPGINGNLFLRWIRTDEGSPNRFVPFVLVSGAASRDVVEDSRDAVACAADAELTEIEGADHLFGGDATAAMVAAVVPWLLRRFATQAR